MRNQILLCICFIVLVTCKPMYNTNKSYVQPITALNFEKQVNKIRQTTKYVTIIHYFKNNDGESVNFAEKFDEFTNEYRGVFRMMFCDCDVSATICEKERITKFPTVKIYPPQPIPSVDFEGPLDIENLLQQSARYLHNNVVEITPENVNTFVTENPSVPKTLLFTEKKGVPMIYKGLSVEFEKKIVFGIVRSTQTSLVERYNIKTFPKMIVVKTSEKKPQVYTGELKFQPMFAFLNVFSEVFVPGGGSAADSGATKHWLMELVPELNQKSANDICLKVEGVVCVILLNNGDKPDNALVDELKQLHKMYERQIQRGNVFKFMWLNAQRETKWAEMFNFTGQTKVVLLNPSRRKRYIEHDGEMTGQSIEKSLEKINGGDAKFIKIGDSLPDLAILKD